MVAPTLRFKEFKESWQLQTIEEILIDYRLGGNYQNEELETGIPLIKMGNIGRGNILLEKVQCIAPNEKINLEDRIKYGDLFFNTRNTLELVGKVAIWRNELQLAYYNSNLMRLKFEDNFFMNYRFNSFQGMKSLRRLATGTTSVAAIYTKDLLRIKLNIPSLPEQQKIASFLSAVDEKIRQLTRKKELLEQYKKGMMQQLFSGKLRFKDEKEKEYPKWEEKRLREVSECLDNLRRPLNEAQRQEMKGDIPYWGANNIVDYVNEYLFDEPLVLLAEDGGNFEDYRTRPIANLSVGRCWVNNHTHVLKGTSICFTEFLFYYLVHKNITGFVSGGTRAKLTKSEMLKIPVSLPSLNEQTKIIRFLASLTSLVEVNKKQIIQIQSFKKGLLQQMFV